MTNANVQEQITYVEHQLTRYPTLVEQYREVAEHWLVDTADYINHGRDVRSQFDMDRLVYVNGKQEAALDKDDDNYETVAKCSKNGDLTVHNQFESIYDTPISGIPVTVVSENDPNDKHTKTSDSSGKTVFTGLKPGTPYRIVIDHAPTQATFDSLFSNYQTMAGDLQQWLKTQWDGTYKPQWLALSNSTLLDKLKDLVVTLLSSGWDALKATWGEIKALFELLCDPVKALSSLKEATSDIIEDIKAAVQSAPGKTQQALLFVSDEAAMFLMANAVIDFITMIPLETVLDALAKEGGRAIVDLIFGILGGIAISFIASPAVGMAFLMIKVGKRIYSVLEPILDKLKEFFDLAIKFVGRNKEYTATHLNGISSMSVGKDGEVKNSVHKSSYTHLTETDSNNDQTHAKPSEDLAGNCTQSTGKTCKNGCPVSMVTGEELLEIDDFTLAGPLPFTFSRQYRTTAAEHASELGFGWSHSLCQHLIFDGNDVVWHDQENKLTRFPLATENAPAIINPMADAALYLGRETNEFLLVQGDLPIHHFTREGNRGRLTGFSDRYGNRLSVRYNHDGQAEAILTQMGTGLWLDYHDNGLLAQLALRTYLKQNNDAHWHTERVLARYRYNERKQLIATRNSADEGEDYEYDNHNVITLRRMAGGAEFFWQWEGSGKQVRALRHWSNTGIDTRYLWDDPSHSVRVVSHDGSVEIYTHDDNAKLVEKTDPDGAVSKKTYDDNGLLIRESDPLGNQTHYRYNTRHQCEAVIYPDGTATHYYYDKGRISEVVANERSWTYRYNRDGEISQKTDPLGHSTEYYYTEQGKLSEIRYADGSNHRLRWNKLGMLIGETLPDGSEASYRHDIFGRIVQETSPSGSITAYHWDDADRLTEVILPGGGRRSYRYNAYGKVTQITDESGATTHYEYAPNSHLVSSVTHPDGSVLHYRYDNAKRFVSQITNERGEQYHITYYGNGLVEQETTFDGRKLRYQYDYNGKLTAKTEIGTEGGELTTTYRRDTMGRLLSKTLPDGREVSYRYDRIGQLVAVDDGEIPLAWQYDPLGRLVAEHQGWASQYYRYDNVGQLTDWQLPDRNHIQYQRQPGGSLEAIVLNNQLLTRHRYTAGLERERQQGEISSQFDYDDQGRLQAHVRQQHGNTQHRRHYNYDARGNLSQIDDSRFGITQFDYDPLGRLTASRGAVNEVFVHDPAGNLLQQHLGSANNWQDVPSHVAGNQLLMQGDSHYEYDEFGRLTTERRGKNQALVTRFGYDCQHRLIHATLPDGTSACYKYDAFGRRTEKVVTDKLGATSTTEFVWRGNTLIAETSDAHYRSYIYQPGSFKPIAMLDGEGQACKVYHYHLDQIGTPTELTDSQGNSVWAAQYRAYGAIRHLHTAEITNPLRFQGQYYDEETGLHYNRHRYYSPNTGRYITTDPIGLAGGLNNTQYVPNPTGWVDPLGLQCVVGNACPGEDTETTSPREPQVQQQTEETPPEPTNSKVRFVTDKAGRTLDMDFIKELKDSGQTFKVSRNGKGRPVTGDPNTFARTEGGGHVVIFGSDGRRIMDISAKRIKFTEWHKGKGGQLFPKEGNTTKFDGPVPLQILDQFNL